MYLSFGIASLITSDISSKIVSITINSLSNTLTLMSQSNEDITIKNYHEELESLDIIFKLKLIDIWLKDKEVINDTSLQLIYNGIKETTHQINEIVKKIEEQIHYHYTKWFHTWRTLDLNYEMKQIKKHTHILNKRIKLINLV